MLTTIHQCDLSLIHQGLFGREGRRRMIRSALPLWSRDGAQTTAKVAYLRIERCASEAIRRLVERGLTVQDEVNQPAAAERAKELAAKAIDKMSDDRARPTTRRPA